MNESSQQRTADIFLSYSRDDQATARRFAEAFERAGFSVWWDQALKSGIDYDKATEAALRSAKAVVVLWSKKSVDSRWVRTEATIALQSQTLVPVTIEACQRPIMFELTQTADLSHWNGDAKDPVWLTFLHDVQQFVSSETTRTAAPLSRSTAAATHRYNKLAWGLCALLALGVAALAWPALQHWRAPPSARPVVRFVHALPEGRTLMLTTPGVLAIAPDGRRLVYSSSEGLVVRDLATLEERVIPGTQECYGVTFSPDGESLAYSRAPGGKPNLIRLTLAGGGEVKLASWSYVTEANIRWEADGSLLVSRRTDGIYRVAGNGGEPERLVAVEGGGSAAAPQLLPGGDWLLFSLAEREGKDVDVVVQSLNTGERRTLVTQAVQPRYLPTGHLLYQQGSTLFAGPFDPQTGALTGAAVPVVQDLRSDQTSVIRHFDVADDGTLIYVAANPAGAGGMALGLTDGAGNEQALDVPEGVYNNPRVSPDGRWVAYEEQYGDGSDIAVYEIGSTSVPRRLTFGGNNTNPAWSADGRRVAYASAHADAPGLYWRAADGSGAEERLTQAPGGEKHVPDDFSRDGKTLAYTVTSAATSAIWQLDLPAHEASLLIETPGRGASHAVFSPDGHWLAYQAYDTGDNEIYVQPFPFTGAKYQVPSRGDNHHPVWSPDGRQLYYLPGPGRLERVALDTSRGVSFGAPVVLTYDPLRGAPPDDARPFDVTPKGAILGTMAQGGADRVFRNRIVVVLNWFEELKQRVPRTGK